MKPLKSRPVCRNCGEIPAYDKPSNYNGIAVVGIVMMLLLLLSLTALFYYLGGPARVTAMANAS